MKRVTINYGGQELTFTKEPDMFVIFKDDKPVVYSATEEEMESKLDELRVQGETGTHIYSLEDRNKTKFIPTGRVFTDASAAAIVANQLQEMAITLDPDFKTLTVTKKSVNPMKICKILQDKGFFAEPELSFKPTLHTISDHIYVKGYQWHLENTGKGAYPYTYFKQGEDAKVKAAWDYLGHYGSSDVRIAIFDSGVEMDHPDFDDSKFADPYNAANGSSNVAPGIGQWHGTPVTGLAAASINGEGTVGTCPNATVVPIKLPNFLNDTMIVKTVNHIKNTGCRVWTNSWGINSDSFVPSTIMQKAIKDLVEQYNVVVIFSSGNSYPRKVNGFAALPYVISCGAVNSKGRVSYYSQGGPTEDHIFIVSPSNDSGAHAGLTSCDVTGTHIAANGKQTFNGYTNGNYTNGFGGTSGAAPILAGIVALLISEKPDLTVDKIREILKSTATKVGGGGMYNPDGHSQAYGYGRVNAFEAAKLVKQDEDDSEEPIVSIPLLDLAIGGGNVESKEFEYRHVELEGEYKLNITKGFIVYFYKGKKIIDSAKVAEGIAGLTVDFEPGLYTLAVKNLMTSKKRYFLGLYKTSTMSTNFTDHITIYDAASMTPKEQAVEAYGNTGEILTTVNLLIDSIVQGGIKGISFQLIFQLIAAAEQAAAIRKDLPEAFKHAAELSEVERAEAYTAFREKFDLYLHGVDEDKVEKIEKIVERTFNSGTELGTVFV